MDLQPLIPIVAKGSSNTISKITKSGVHKDICLVSPISQEDEQKLNLDMSIHASRNKKLQNSVKKIYVGIMYSIVHRSDEKLEAAIKSQLVSCNILYLNINKIFY